MRALADLLYPELCVGCGRRAEGGLCRSCAGGFRRLGLGVCRCCGAPLGAGDAAATVVDGCRRCRDLHPAFDHARQAVAFDPVVRAAVHRLKYRGERSLAGALASLVVALVRGPAGGGLGWLDDASPPVATWVPAPTARIRQRGCDHARLLAEEVAEGLGWPAMALLRRVRDVPAQVTLETQARRRNLDRAFAAVSLAPTRVVVVDDVYTTGATASEAARALKAGGAERVVVLGVARAFRPGRRL